MGTATAARAAGPQFDLLSYTPLPHSRSFVLVAMGLETRKHKLQLYHSSGSQKLRPPSGTKLWDPEEWYLGAPTFQL